MKKRKATVSRYNPTQTPVVAGVAKARAISVSEDASVVSTSVGALMTATPNPTTSSTTLKIPHAAPRRSKVYPA